MLVINLKYSNHSKTGHPNTQTNGRKTGKNDGRKSNGLTILFLVNLSKLLYALQLPVHKLRNHSISGSEIKWFRVVRTKRPSGCSKTGLVLESWLEI
jgi:hypothetical protein